MDDLGLLDVLLALSRRREAAQPDKGAAADLELQAARHAHRRATRLLRHLRPRLPRLPYHARVDAPP